MTKIVSWKQSGIRNVMTAADYESRDLQAQLVEKFWRQGKTNEEAKALARKEISDPTIISFVSDPLAPLKSPNKVYGHAGHDDLYKLLVDAGKCQHTTRVVKLLNLEEWNLPTPTEADVEAVFGTRAVWIYREYRKLHDL